MSREAKAAARVFRNRKCIGEKLEQRRLLSHQPVGFADLVFRVTSLLADPVRNLVYAVGDDQVLHVVDTDTARESRRVPLLHFPGGGAGITPDGAFLIIPIG